METTRITTIKANIYIPPLPHKNTPQLPKHHPSLIVADALTDASHSMSCGCKGDSCIAEKAVWIYGPNGEVKNGSVSDISSTDAIACQNLMHDSHGREI